MPETMISGWAFVANGRKCHWFATDRSLCGKAAFWGDRKHLDTVAGVKGPDDCAECRRRLDAQVASPPAPEATE